jgi:hypothetical protein
MRAEQNRKKPRLALQAPRASADKRPGKGTRSREIETGRRARPRQSARLSARRPQSLFLICFLPLAGVETKRETGACFYERARNGRWQKSKKKNRKSGVPRASCCPLTVRLWQTLRCSPHGATCCRPLAHRPWALWADGRAAQRGERTHVNSRSRGISSRIRVALDLLLQFPLEFV